MVFISIPVGHGKHYKDICLLLILFLRVLSNHGIFFYDQTLVSRVTDMQSVNLTCPLILALIQFLQPCDLSSFPLWPWSSSIYMLMH